MLIWSALFLALTARGAMPPRPRGPARPRGAVGASGLALPSFPFPIEELLLPGESKELHLYEPRFLALLEEARASGELCAQMIYTDDGLCSLGALLSLESLVRREIGVNVVVRAVGRVRFLDVTSAEPFVTALYAPVVDVAQSTAKQRAVLRAQAAEACELHAGCVQLRTKLMRASAAGAPGAALDDDDAAAEGALVSWGHELLRPESGFSRPLDAQLRDALAALDAARARARAAPPPAGWLVSEAPSADEAADLEASLVGLLACACFPVASRVAAAALLDSAERMDTALELLRGQRALLAAKAALVDALGAGG
jgi:Lon protease-like protein